MKIEKNRRKSKIERINENQAVDKTDKQKSYLEYAIQGILYSWS